MFDLSLIAYQVSMCCDLSLQCGQTIDFACEPFALGLGRPTLVFCVPTNRHQLINLGSQVEFCGRLCLERRGLLDQEHLERGELRLQLLTLIKAMLRGQLLIEG